MDYDVIVIGAGSVGVPTALNLAKHGLKTLVIDNNQSPGQGENKKAIGGIRATHSNMIKSHICARSLEIFSNWEDQYDDDIEWNRGGYCFVAYNESDELILKKIVSQQREIGLKIDYVSKEKIMDLVPGINSEGLLGGTWSPNDGNASPLLAINAFYHRSKELGVDYKFGERVVDIKITNGQIVGVKTDKSNYFCDTVVNASGAGAAKIGEIVGVELPVIPDSHEAGITELVKPFLSTMVVDIRPEQNKIFGDSKNYYFYQNKRGQIIFCLTPSPPIVGNDIRETSSFLPQISQRMVSLLPRLRHIRIRRTWRGLYPMTPDGFPIVGSLDEIDGFYNAVGLCGQGYMMGPGLGETIARSIAGVPTKFDQKVEQEFSLYRDFSSVEKLK